MTTVRCCKLTSHRGDRSLEEGFSLVEAVVSSFILVVIFAGFGRSMGTAYLGSHGNAAAQEATAIGVEQLEFSRSLAWNQIAMSSVMNDSPLVDQSGGSLAGPEVGLESSEPLVVDQDAGRIDPTETDSVDGVAYTVWCTVSEAPEDLKRVTVLIEWTTSGVTVTHRTSTLIAEASTR
jgi:hypothetical protein